MTPPEPVGEYAQFVHWLLGSIECLRKGQQETASALMRTLREEFTHHVQVFERKTRPTLLQLGTEHRLLQSVDQVHRAVCDLLDRICGELAGTATAGEPPAAMLELKLLLNDHATLERTQLSPIMRRLWLLNLQGLDDLPSLD